MLARSLHARVAVVPGSGAETRGVRPWCRMPTSPSRRPPPPVRRRARPRAEGMRGGKAPPDRLRKVSQTRAAELAGTDRPALTNAEFDVQFFDLLQSANLARWPSEVF